MARDFEYNDTADQDAKRARRAARTLRDILRKTFAQSGDARQTTEDLLRAVLGEVKIPREYVNIILQQVNATRGELVRVVAGEVRTFLDEANLGEELAKILTSLSFEIRTEIRFIPNDEALRPSVKSRVGIKSARATDKTHNKRAYERHTHPDEEDDDFVETRGSAAIDKAIQSRVAALANLFLKGVIDIADDDVDVTAWGDEDETDLDTPPTDSADETSDVISEDEEDAHKRSGFNPLNPRDYRMRVSLSPDIRRRAEAAATQVATAGRVTATLSAATAASAVSAAATRAQAVVRGGRNLTSADARDAMWKKWVSLEEPDIVGNPVIGAPMGAEPFEPAPPRRPSHAVRSRHDQGVSGLAVDSTHSAPIEDVATRKHPADPPTNVPTPAPQTSSPQTRPASPTSAQPPSTAYQSSQAEAPHSSEEPAKSQTTSNKKSPTQGPKKTASASQKSVKTSTSSRADKTTTEKTTGGTKRATTSGAQKKSASSKPKRKTSAAPTAASPKSVSKSSTRPKTSDAPIKKE